MHNMLITHQEENFKLIFERTVNHNYFWAIFLRGNDTQRYSLKMLTQLSFKLLSISIRVIRSYKHFLMVSM